MLDTKTMQERFSQLPAVVQNAITSSDIEQHLRGLADKHKLHIDQWQLLENEVMLTLLGFEPVEDLQTNLFKQLNIPDETARELALNINQHVFEPIREELERQLAHPEAQKPTESGVEAVRSQTLNSATQPAPSSPSAVAPATPPTPPPTANVTRGPASGIYKPGEPSTERKSVADDPYREAPQ